MRPILQLMNAQQLSISHEINKVRSQVLRKLLWLNVELEGNSKAIERRDLVALIRQRLGVSRSTAYDYATTLLLLNRRTEDTAS